MGAPIPSDNHVVRHCKKSAIDDEGRINLGAFLLRDLVPAREEFLSVNWLEKLPGSSESEQIDELRKIHPKKLKKGEQLAVLNVGQASEFVRLNSQASKLVRFLDESHIQNFSHAGIHDTDGPDEQETAQLLADAICRSYPAT